MPSRNYNHCIDTNKWKQAKSWAQWWTWPLHLSEWKLFYFTCKDTENLQDILPVLFLCDDCAQFDEDTMAWSYFLSYTVNCSHEVNLKQPIKTWMLHLLSCWDACQVSYNCSLPDSIFVILCMVNVCLPCIHGSVPEHIYLQVHLLCWQFEWLAQSMMMPLCACVWEITFVFMVTSINYCFHCSTMCNLCHSVIFDICTWATTVPKLTK